MAKNTAYSKIENIITEKVTVLENQINSLQNENAQLKNELAIANAKLEVYERIASISDSKATLGFGPPVKREE